MWRFLVILCGLAFICLLPGSRLSGTFPCMFSFLHTYVSLVWVITERDGTGSSPFLADLTLPFHKELLCSKACASCPARKCSKGRKSMISMVGGATPCCKLIPVHQFLVFHGQAGLCSRHMPFWYFLGPLWTFVPGYHSLGMLSQRGVCVWYMSVFWCVASWQSQVYKFLCHALKSSEGFLRRKSERPRRSELEGTRDPVCHVFLSNSSKLRPRH